MSHYSSFSSPQNRVQVVLLGSKILFGSEEEQKTLQILEVSPVPVPVARLNRIVAARAASRPRVIGVGYKNVVLGH